jgi:hypothetical protein
LEACRVLLQQLQEDPNFVLKVVTDAFEYMGFTQFMMPKRRGCSILVQFAGRSVIFIFLTIVMDELHIHL